MIKPGRRFITLSIVRNEGKLLMAVDMKGGEIGVNKLSFTTNIVGSRHFPKLQYSHLTYTVLGIAVRGFLSLPFF